VKIFPFGYHPDELQRWEFEWKIAA